jgi:predicted dehydrogenase
MKTCVIGYGSIGKRHHSVLKNMGHEVVIVSKHFFGPSAYSSFSDALQQNSDIAYVVICNDTADHYSSLKVVTQNFAGKVLVEKPIFHKDQAYPNAPNIFVAYNLRFHPILREIKRLTELTPVISAHSYVGQYLPSWRPGTEYQKSYSSQKVRGGGVLRDLSHELDYCLWLFGAYQSIASIQGKFSNLEISSDDFDSCLYQAEKAKIVTINVNYLDRLTQRELIINTNDWTLKADLIANTLNVNGEITKYTLKPNQTYTDMHTSVLGEGQIACTVVEGIRVVKMIDAIEKNQLP